MNRTIALYDENAYERSFTATVLQCLPKDEGYEVILDRTAFFPEQGGQVSDRGTLNDAAVYDVQISDGVITHYTDRPLAEGSRIEGKIDWDRRFDLMQNHTGEHILSGIICNNYHCNNVGFRLAEDNCTVDYDIPLTGQQLEEAERLANQAIWADLPVEVSYPDDEQLAVLEYRSKKELSGAIRIVTIPSVDVCACCAPHLHHTGEAGLLKIMSVEKHKSGVRLYILSGQRAYSALKENYDITESLVHALSAERHRLPGRISDMLAQLDRQSRELSAVKVQLLRKQLQNTDEDPTLFFCRDVLEKDIREVINEFVAAHPECICGGFWGSDEEGFRFVMAGGQNMKQLAQELRGRLNLQGGGSEQMIQGTVRNSRQQIEEVLHELFRNRKRR